MEVKATAALGEDPYQLLGKGLKADRDQLFVVVAVSGAVISPDMHDVVLCVCPRRLVQQAGRKVSRCGSSNRSDMQVASGVKPLSVYMSKVGVANQERREPALLWQSQCRRRLSCAVQSWGLGCGRGNSVCYSRRRSVWSVGCGNGLWSVGCSNGLWSAGCGNGLWQRSVECGLWQRSVECGLWQRSVECGLWQQSVECGLWQRSVECGLWQRSVECGLWQRSVECGLWQQSVECGLWQRSVECGLWQRSVECGLWQRSVECGLWQRSVKCGSP